MNLRAAQVRIYVDADLLGLGKILASLRNDVTYPGDPGAFLHKRQRAACPITSPDVLDTDWIPQVAARGWPGRRTTPPALRPPARTGPSGRTPPRVSLAPGRQGRAR